MKTKILLLLMAIGLMSASCLGNNGPLGVIKTYDGGGAWQTMNRIANDSKNNIGGLQITELAFNPNNHEQLFASAINGGLWQSDDSAQNWSQILSKIEANDFALNPVDTKNIFVSGIYNSHGKIARTRDGGQTWEEVYNEASSDNPVRSITVNTRTPNEIYAGLESGVIFKSIDGGTNWFVLKNFDDQLLKIRFDSHSGAIYALLHLKGLEKSTDGGVTWQNLTPSLKVSSSDLFGVQSSPYIKMSIDDQQSGVIYLTTLSGLFKTIDDGKSWSFINLPVKSSAQKPRAVSSTRGGLVAYTSIGNTIYKTLDGGKSWQTQSLPTTEIVNKIIIDPVLAQVAYAGLINAQ